MTTWKFVSTFLKGDTGALVTPGDKIVNSKYMNSLHLKEYNRNLIRNYLENE